MMLRPIFGVVTALTVAGLASAQDDDVTILPQPEQLRMDHGMDATGVDIRVENAYPDGLIAILVSTTTGSFQLPGRFGGDTVSLGSPWLLVLDETDDDYHLSIPLDTQAFAELGITVHVQAVTIDAWESEEFAPGESPPPPAKVSNLVTLDFAAGMAASLAANPAEAERCADDEGGEGDACRCPDGEDAIDKSVDH